MKNLSKLFLILVLLSSCSPQQRLTRLIKKHPELVTRDTIYRYDTTTVMGVEHDTIFKSGITKDTIIIKDHQMTIKYFNDGKTTYIKGKVDTITVIKRVPFVVNKLQVTELTWWQKVKLWVVDNLALLVLIGMFIAWVFKKYLSTWNQFSKFLPKP